MKQPEKAFLKFEWNDEPLEFLFNPETISITKANKWEAPGRDKPQPGKPAPTLMFKGQESGSLSFTLIFDTTDTGAPVTNYTNKLLSYMEIDPNLPGTDQKLNNARPPTVVLHWGQLSSFPAVINSADITFDYFSSTGVPLRAKVQLKLTQAKYSPAFTKQNPTSGTPFPHRVHRIQPGETLDRISARYYGDPTRWRMLATANGVEDPLAIRPGSLLTVPQLSSG